MSDSQALSRSNSLQALMQQGSFELISIGLCAMDKKVEGKPMKELLKRLEVLGTFKFVKFGNETLTEKPISEWPTCDVLIAFFSDGFPLEKAIEYAKMYPNMYLMNDLDVQLKLFDRRWVYKMLKDGGVPTPVNVNCNRNDPDPTWPDSDLQEFEDYIICDGVKISKPFVEKPVSGEDHNVWIYYPRSAGGGIKKLFRKIGDKSSDFCPDESNVRRDGSFIYEEFMPTEGTDVKVYAVGPDYAHAEARKSPAVDGVVQRSEDGKEVRYPVMLTRRQKKMAHDVVNSFKQTVCGFDLLVCGPKSYVCDVNGWSFVKNSTRFWDDAAKTLSEIIFAQRRTFVRSFSDITERISRIGPSPAGIEEGKDENRDKNEEEAESKMEELRCVVALVRHGDRTPKQKMKMKMKAGSLCQPILDLFDELMDKPDKPKELKLKTAKELTMVLENTRELLKKLHAEPSENKDFLSTVSSLEQMKTVLEKGGKFSGINRKVQLKPNKWDSVEEGPKNWKITEIQLVLKWGGNLTQKGKEQAKELGYKAREMLYPGNDEEFLRIHNSYRHDLKIYSSDEGRVQMTAAAFTKAFLSLEGDLTPILVSLISKDRDAHSMLDPSGVNLGKQIQEETREMLRELMQKDEDITEATAQNIALSTTVKEAIAKMGNPCQCLAELRRKVFRLLHEIENHINRQKKMIVVGGGEGDSNDVGDMIELHDGETLRLMHSRWSKLYEDIYDEKKETFNISKIPDIYDCAKYDAVHNQSSLGLKELDELYQTSWIISTFVGPSEYGMTRRQRIHIASTICRNLIEKIQRDVEGVIPKKKTDHSTDSEDEQDGLRLNPDFMEDDTVADVIKTRLYFSSESHILSVLNTLRYCHLINEGGTCDSDVASSPGNEQLFSNEAQKIMNEFAEYDYLSQIVIKVYEDLTMIECDDNMDRFSMEIGVSPGVAGDAMADYKNEAAEDDGRKARDIVPIKWLHGDHRIPVKTFFKLMRNVSAFVEKQRSEMLAGRGMDFSTKVEAQKMQSFVSTEDSD